MQTGLGRVFDEVYSRITGWCEKIFSIASRDRLERADRFFEEAVELHQSVYASEGQAFKGFQRAKLICDYTYSRPPDSVHIEIGGAFCTLMALYNACHDGVSLVDILDDEMERCEAMPLDKIVNKLSFKCNQGISYYYMTANPDGNDDEGHSVWETYIHDSRQDRPLKPPHKTNWSFRSRLDRVPEIPL